MPDVEEYLLYREYDSAMHTALDLIELAEGIVLPEEVLAHEPLQQMRRAAARTIAYFNDLVSYPKEVLINRNPNNLVHVLMTQRGCSYEDAMAEAVHVVNAYACELLELEPIVMAEAPGPREDLRRFILGMRRWQRGNVESSLEQRRYVSKNSPFAALRPSQTEFFGHADRFAFLNFRREVVRLDERRSCSTTAVHA